MIKLNEENRNLCCGCEACKEICPVNCITMEYDSEGFLFPVVDKEKCINCNKCVNVCSIFSERKNLNEKIKNTEVFAAWNKDEKIRKESSSGGIFSLLAENTLNNNGIVIGAMFNENNVVEHNFVNNIKDLYKLRGSKYVQSSTNGMYSLTKKYLEEGKEVLYSGTPCQIEGLYKFLNKKYENLITCGIVCHSVPSPQIFSDYLKYLESKYKSKAKNIFFRKKTKGWRNSNFCVEFENKNIFEESIYKNYFFQGFGSCLYSRRSCYSCKYKLNSDIIIGDFWGIELSKPEIDDNKGISLVVSTSEKGKKILKKIENKSEYFISNLENAILKNPNILSPSYKNSARKDFYSDYNRLGFEGIINKYLETDKKKLSFSSFLYRVKRKIMRKLLGRL